MIRSTTGLIHMQIKIHRWTHTCRSTEHNSVRLYADVTAIIKSNHNSDFLHQQEINCLANCAVGLLQNMYRYQLTVSDTTNFLQFYIKTKRLLTISHVSKQTQWKLIGLNFVQYLRIASRGKRILARPRQIIFPQSLLLSGHCDAPWGHFNFSDRGNIINGDIFTIKYHSCLIGSLK